MVAPHAQRRARRVVGAGASGLAAALALRARGVEALVLERSERVGTSWRTRYDRLRLNTTRRSSRLPGRPIAARHSRWVPREAYADYLASCAAQLRVAYRTEVCRVDPAPGGWEVRTTEDAVRTRAVVVATGFDRVPRLPSWPGREEFAGSLIHAGEYRNADPFAGLDVLVVGAGTSGNEIAVDLLEGGAGRVSVAVRTPPLTFPREWHGIALPALARLGAGLPGADWATTRTHRLVYGDLGDVGLRPPDTPVSVRLERDGHALAVDGGLVALARAGRVSIVLQ